MSGRKPPPKPETAPRTARAAGLRLLRFLLSLLVVWWALQFLAWPRVQPLYASAVAGVADSALALVEAGRRVTRLEAAGSLIHVFTELSAGESPLLSWDADVLHFYIVLYASLFLVFPSLGVRRRLGLLAAALAALFIFHVAAILIKVEYLYAVEMEEISARHYSAGAIAAYSWLHDTVIFFAVQLVPALALVVLVVLFGGFGRRPFAALRSPVAGTAAGRMRAGTPGLKWLAWPALCALAFAVVAIFLLRLNVDARQAEMDIRLGYRWLRVPDAVQAAGSFESALERAPDLAEAHLGLGMARMLEGDLTEAAGEFHAALELDPESTGALLQLGKAFHAMNDFLGALEPLERFVSAQPGHEEGGRLLASALKRVDRRAEAEAVLRRVLESHPDSFPAVMDLSASLFVSGRSCEAVPYLDRLGGLPLDARQAALVAQSRAEVEAACGGK